MKIESGNPLRNAAVRKAKSTGGASGSTFSLSSRDEDGETTSTGGVAAGSAIGSVDALLALQEVDDGAAERERAKTRANEILDRLDELRAGLLVGSMPRDRLEQLGHLARSRRGRTNDPRLDQVLDEIDLRAQVELAKLDSNR